MKLFVGLMMCFVTTTQAISLTIYYEALCYDSVRFITRQLYPIYSHFRDHLEIEFIPYGKAMHSIDKTTGKYSFSCQHGKEECKGNKLHACALNQINDNDLRVNFITCIMSADNPANIFYIEECSKKYSLDFNQISQCALSKDGDKLLAVNGDKTWKLEPNLDFVPTVVFNNSTDINFNDQRRALTNFKMLLCSKIDGFRPDICGDSSLLDKIKNLFINQ